MLLIRAAIPDDVPLLMTFFQEFAAHERLSTVITEQQLRQDAFGTRPKFRALIAEVDGQPVGYALFFDYYSSFRGPAIFLEDLFVLSQFRGKRVGRALLAHVARITKDANAFGIIFNVIDRNTEAIRFYRKVGAIFLDDRRTVCLEQNALHDLASEV